MEMLYGLGGKEGEIAGVTKNKENNLNVLTIVQLS
jgi:hypothetical protein